MRAGTSISLGDALHLHLEPLSKVAGLQLLQSVLAKLRFAGGHPPSPELAPALLQSAGASPLSAGLLSVLALHAARGGTGLPAKRGSPRRLKISHGMATAREQWCRR